MIRSMVSKMIRSMITTVINPFDGLISRYFVTLDPVLNSHYEMAAPITFTGDFEIEFEFSTTFETGCLISGTFAGENSFNIIIRNGLIRAFIYVGSTVSDNLLPTDYISDGKLNTVKVTYNGTTASIFINGAFADSTTWSANGAQDIKFFGGRTGAFDFFDGIIANAKFTDKSGARDVVTTFKLDNSPAAANYVYGGEEVVNGDFATDSDWVKGTNWSISGGYAIHTGAGDYINQGSLSAGATYIISFDVIVANSSNFPQIYMGGLTQAYTAAGHYEKIIVATSQDEITGIRFRGLGNCSIDNVSVKEVTNYTEANAASEIEYSQENVFGADLWDGENLTSTDASSTVTTITSGQSWNVSSTTGSLGNISKGGRVFSFQGLTLGKSYRYTLESSKPVNLAVYDDSYSVINSALNSTELVFTASSVTRIYVCTRDTSVVTVSNISVKEITNAVEYKNIPQTARELYTLEDDTWVGSNELVVNGDFATDSDWIKGTGISISGGSAVFDSVPSTQILRQSIVFKIGAKYIVTFTISGYVEGGIFVRQPANDQSNTFTSNGTHTTTITATNTSVLDLRAAGLTTLLIDNISIVKAIEVADFIEPVTQGMTLTEAWTTRGTAYLGLRNTTYASVRVDATISNTDDGILMESGGSGSGLILYVYNGVLYFQCGYGIAYGTATNRAEVSYTLPVGEADYIIEWSADTSKAVLYVNGLVVGSQTFSNTNLSGTDHGTLGEVQSTVPVNRGGWTTDGSGVYTNTITKCDVFNNQITSDV